VRRGEKGRIGADPKKPLVTLALLATLALKLGQLSLHLSLEGDFYFTRALLGYLEVGFVLGTAKNGGVGSFTFVPAGLGVKYQFRDDKDLRPYVGLGLGLGFLTSLLGGSSLDSVAFRVDGRGGLAYVPWRHVGFNLEVGLGLDTRLLWGVNVELGLLVLF